LDADFFCGYNIIKMKKIIKTLAKIIGIICLSVLALFLFFILVSTITEFKPKDREQIKISGAADKKLSPGDTFSILSWNIGYSALGENTDFFYDGGKMIYGDDKPVVLENISEIENHIEKENCNVVFLQEVDISSARSHFVNELKYLADQLTGFNYSHAVNYKVLFIPIPFPPMGKVNCGISTFSSYPFKSSERIALPCPFSYPMRLFNLKWALLVNRVKLENSEKELVLVNLHLEAYDSGEGKIAQTKMLKDLLESEAAKGNYVIAGGDFNQTFSGTDTSMYPHLKDSPWEPLYIDETEFSQDLKFVADSSIPTCRSLQYVYAGADKSPDAFQYYMLDGFILSSNVELNYTETQDLGFVNSDHNPVKISVTLR